MRYFRLIVGTLIFLVGGFGLWSQSAVVEYAEGTVEQRLTNNTWKEVLIGDTIASGSSVRVRNNGLVELRSSGILVSINKDGTYVLSDLIANLQAKGKSNVNSLVSGKVSKIMNGNTMSQVPTAVGGVRGSAQSSGTMLWAEEEAPNSRASLDELKGLVSTGEYAAALKKSDDLLSSKDADKTDVRILRAQIYGLQGRPAVSLKEIKIADVGKNDPRYLETALLAANQALELSDWEGALFYTQEALSLKPDDESVQVLSILQALAYKAASDVKKSEELLNKAIALGPNTQAGKEASRLKAATSN